MSAWISDGESYKFVDMEKWYKDCDGVETLVEVTYWQPMPEPPEVGK